MEFSSFDIKIKRERLRFNLMQWFLDISLLKTCKIYEFPFCFQELYRHHLLCPILHLYPGDDRSVRLGYVILVFQPTTHLLGVLILTIFRRLTGTFPV